MSDTIIWVILTLFWICFISCTCWCCISCPRTAALHVASSAPVPVVVAVPVVVVAVPVVPKPTVPQTITVLISEDPI